MQLKTLKQFCQSSTVKLLSVNPKANEGHRGGCRWQGVQALIGTKSRIIATGLLAGALAASPLRASVTADDAAIRSAYQKMQKATTQRNAALLSSLLMADFYARNLDGSTETGDAYVKDDLERVPGVSITSVRIIVRKLTIHGASAAAEVTSIVVGTYMDNGVSKPLQGVWHVSDEWTRVAGIWKLHSTVERQEITYVGGRIVENQQEQLPPTNAAIAELRNRAVVIPTLALDSSPGDFLGIGASIGNARIVGMGEGSHGSNEFFAFKDRLFKYLVEKKGFTVFAMEAYWGAGLNVDRYIKTGHGTAQQAVASLGFWTWDTPQVVDLIQWMRDYNAQPGSHPTLSFYGIDMQDPMGAIGFLATYLHSHDAAEVVAARGALDCAVDAAALYRAKPAPGCREQVAAVGAQLATLKDAPEIAIARASVTNILQYLDWKTLPDDSRGPARDKDMAENVKWLASYEPSARIAVWAHNGHIGASGDVWRSRPMGFYLRSAFGPDYYAIGQTFGSGTVRAFVAGHGLQSVAVPATQNDAISALFAPLHSAAFVDLRDIPKASALEQYFAGYHGIEEIGATIDPQHPESQKLPMVVPNFFDGLVYVPTSTAATDGSSYSEMHREIRAGGAIWQVSGVGFDDVTVKAGPAIATLANSDGLNATPTTLVQHFDAAAYTGRTVRVKGEVQLSDLLGFVVPIAEVARANGSVILSSQGDETGEATNGKWVPFVITLEVPQKASFIDAGFWAEGLGGAAVRNISITQP
jgi:erythromycin esterase